MCLELSALLPFIHQKNKGTKIIHACGREKSFHSQIMKPGSWMLGAAMSVMEDAQE